MAVEVNDEFRPVEEFQPEEFQGDIQLPPDDDTTDDEGPLQFQSDSDEDASVDDVRLDEASPEPILAEAIPIIDDEDTENIPPPNEGPFHSVIEYDPESEYEYVPNGDEIYEEEEIEYQSETEAETDTELEPEPEYEPELEPEPEAESIPEPDVNEESSEEMEMESESNISDSNPEPKPVPVWEIMTELNARSANGRVVVNPPSRMAKLEQRLTGEAWYICERCGRAFLQQDKLLQHRADHEDGVIFEVKPEPAEEVVTPTKIKIKKSLLEKYSPGLLYTWQHRKVRPHKCIQCGAAFLKRPHLQEHIRKSHAAHHEYECSYCTCRFRTVKGRSRHAAMYHLKNAFLTQDADDCQPQAGGLMRAQQIFNASKLKTQRDFRLKAIKNIRTKIAKSNRKTGTAQSVKIRRPIKKSKKTGKFQCHICYKVLSKEYTLRQHMFIHTGAKPFQCMHCFQNFRLYTTMCNHIKSAHFGPGSFKCEYCDCTYKTSSVLKSHMKRVHTEVPC